MTGPAHDQPAPAVVLALPLEPNEAGAATVRDYLIELLATLWREKEGFSGKRPFGDSGWQYDVYTALAAAGLIDLDRDEHGYIDTCDTETGDRIIAAAIEHLRTERPTPTDTPTGPDGPRLYGPAPPPDAT